MSKADPGVAERVRKYEEKQIKRNKKDVRVWVDIESFDSGTNLFDPEASEQVLVLTALEDPVAFVIGWKRARDAWRKANGIKVILPNWLEVELQDIRALSDDSTTVIDMSVEGKTSIDGPVTPIQLQRLARLSQRVADHGQS